MSDTIQIEVHRAMLNERDARIATLSAQVRAHTKADSERRREEAVRANVEAREKALDGLYTFPEVGEGKWPLRKILAVFKAAQAVTEDRDLRRTKDRMRLSNPRLVAHLRACGFGQKISTGRGANAYRIYFMGELIAEVQARLHASEK